ncbi:MAG TPA: hypothetical protein PLY76_05470 [Flavobacteriales bacterium]|nr:hypothetical protein [Flavobacteriales bacterium]HRP81326.1 hypothetical protein [Flavobacteriales bacterium]
MRKSFLIISAAATVAMLGLHSCSHTLLTGGQEGTIKFAMSFPDLDPNGLMTDMLPREAILSFNRDHQSMDLSAGMGIFKTSMVVNTPSKVVEYHMSVMGKSLVAEFTRRDLINLNKAQPPLAVLHTMARDTIAGMPCKQAFLLYEDISMPEVEVWYTEQLEQENPNWYGPYSEIPGVLMRYDVVQHNIRMHMEATTVNFGPVDPGMFLKRPEHQEVSPEVLYQQLDEVLGAFNN